MAQSLEGRDEYVSPRKMRIYLPPPVKKGESPKGTGTVLPDSATVSDHSIKNDDVLYVVFRQQDDGDDNDDEADDCWEDVEIEKGIDGSD